MKLKQDTRVSVTLPIESPGRCPDCGALSLVYLGDPLANVGLWKCACSWRQLGKAPRDPTIRQDRIVEATNANFPVSALGGPPRVPLHLQAASVPKGRPVPPKFVLPEVAKPTPAAPVNSGVPRQHKPLQYGQVTRVVCEAIGVTIDEVESVQRHPEIVLAREIIIHLLREHSHMSYPDIAGRIRGNSKKNATTWTAHERIRNQMDTSLDERLSAASGMRGKFSERTVGELVESIRGRLK